MKTTVKEKTIETPMFRSRKINRVQSFYAHLNFNLHLLCTSSPYAIYRT
ncbi:unnamed protein product, partial [Brassica oleracea var. botrytis]